MTPSRPARPPRMALPALLAAWTLALAAGFVALWRHAGAEGAAPAAPQARLPAEDARGLLATGTPSDGQGRRPTLLLFAHPHCPCTRASVAELNRLLAACEGEPGAPRVFAVFVRPEGAPAGWERTETWAAASRLPGVTVLADEDARLARRFDARTSGQVFLYDAAGRLRFAGGITGGRGHEGDNPGRDAVTALIRGAADTEATKAIQEDGQSGSNGETVNATQGRRGVGAPPPPTPPVQKTPVFGCALR